MDTSKYLIFGQISDNMLERLEGKEQLLSQCCPALVELTLSKT